MHTYIRYLVFILEPTPLSQHNSCFEIYLDFYSDGTLSKERPMSPKYAKRTKKIKIIQIEKSEKKKKEKAC